MQPIKISILGGYMCGKTSLIASVFDQMLNGELNKIFTVADRTMQENKVSPIHGKEECKTLLINKRMELIRFIEKGDNNTFIVDQAPTMNSREYNMQIQISGTTKVFGMDFMDIPGSFMQQTSHYSDGIVEEIVEESDVYVVVIDTPFMMEGSRAENSLANCIDQIHCLLVSGCDGIKAKQVIFVPLKCEKWVQEVNGYDKVVRKVEEVYSSTIKELKVRQTEISIIPIQTAGGIVFDSLKPAYRVVNDNDEIVVDKCSILNDGNIIDRNGNLHKLQLNEFVIESGYKYYRTNIDIPIAWYRLKNDAQYRPYNCEQLPLHILRFMFNKFMKETPGGFFGDLGSFLFGSITVNDMQECLNELSKANLIKDNVEGIKTIKKCF